MSTSDMSITATVGRYGAFNAVNLVIQKSEESANNAAFEIAYRAAVGKPFYFGFKSGDPVAFVVTEVGNEAKVQQGLFAAKGVTNLVLSAVVKDKDLAALREALTSRQIDAVRMNLAGDVQIEKSVGDENGRQLMEKFSCFYQSLDERGISLPVAADPKSQPGQSASVSDNGPRRDYAASAQGKYVRKGKSSDFLELGPDGMYALLESEKSVGGNYKVQGDTLILTSPRFKGQSKGRFIGDTIVDADGILWEKQAETQKSAAVPLTQKSAAVPLTQKSAAVPLTQKSAAAPLTIDQIIQMVAAKLPDDIIITTIQKSSSKFELNPEALIKLKTAGVNDAVIRAITQAGARSPAPGRRR